MIARTLLTGAACLALAADARAQPGAARATALADEGAKQREARAFDQALANFLAAYAALPRAGVLLDIAATLRDLGRPADAANTYHRYLAADDSDRARHAEVRGLLRALDDKLAVIALDLEAPAEVSIDGGPFVEVPAAVLTRLRPGLHLIRIRRPDGVRELSLHAFAGVHQQLGAPRATDAGATSPWLTTGTLYATDDPAGPRRSLPAVRAIEPAAAIVVAAPARTATAAVPPTPPRDRFSAGASALIRIDGALRGFAAGIGLAVSRGRLGLDLVYLRAEVNGGYAGARYRLRRGTWRPYVAAGVPAFLYDDLAEATSKLALGVRAAGGLEVALGARLSVQADVGYEHFFGLDSPYASDLLVPTLGVIGTL